MEFRNLEKNDYNKGYLDLLAQLTEVNKENITFEKFSNFIKNLDENHKIVVIIHKDKIVASGTLFIENKIIHGISKVGHIEDIVVDTESRGLGLGKKIVNHMTNLAKENNCYKVILNCKEENCGFYQKCGYIRKETEMVQYFEESKTIDISNLECNLNNITNDDIKKFN
jgi:glucosamine-phosphate N-acetyltransferase